MEKKNKKYIKYNKNHKRKTINGNKIFACQEYDDFNEIIHPKNFLLSGLTIFHPTYYTQHYENMPQIRA